MSGRGGEQIHSIDQSILWSSARRVGPRFAYSDSRSRSLTFDKNNSSTLSTREENAEVQPWAARASFFLAQSCAVGSKYPGVGLQVVEIKLLAVSLGALHKYSCSHAVMPS